MCKVGQGTQPPHNCQSFWKNWKILGVPCVLEYFVGKECCCVLENGFLKWWKMRVRYGQVFFIYYFFFN